MELLAALLIGLLTAAGVYLVLRPRSFDVIIGLTLLTYAVNVFLFVMGRLSAAKAPIIRPDLPPTLAAYADPLPQALVLTAIVISFGMTAVLLVIAVRAHGATGSDHIDGVDRPAGEDERP